ncbi:MAG: amidohydrolase family protein [Proteobacteria bacterium]|nr:amidohydrolase family protein [Pseudomonadota bacterium]MDA1324947.1 amidohydrolase family protein [Pseudomonadota bacterium]
MPPVSPLPDLNTRTPRISVPRGACDTHAHIFGPMDEYPPKQNRRYDPPDCGIGRFKTMLGALGVERGVMVQSSAYGTDNRVLLDGIAEAGKNFRGVALVAPDVSRQELRRLDEGGIRGIRASTLPNASTGVADMAALAHRIADLGWVFLVHLQHIRELPQVAPIVTTLPVPCVIDNFGRIRGKDGIDDPDFQHLLRLFEREENCWVKLCSFYRLSDAGPPEYDDMEPFARALIDICPDRVIWGTNWPHPNCPVAMPNDGDLFDVLFGWIDDETVRHKILVDNPAKLFGFL